jgi:hypothetical protein
MTVQVADAHAHVQRLVSVVKMAILLEGCTVEEHLSHLRFSWKKGHNAKDIHKDIFTVGSVCHVQRFSLGGKRFAHDEEVETEVRKWLRQQSQDFYAAGFGALAKRWDKCSSVGGGYVEK